MAALAQYPPELRARCAELIADGESNLAVARTLGVSEPTVRRWRSEALHRARVADTPDAAAWAAKRDAAVEDVVTRTDRLAAAFDWLRPVEMPAPEPPTRPKVKATPRTVVLSDTHFGCEDEAALEVAFQTIAALRPARVLFNGDLFDLLAVSKFPKDARRGATWTLQDEAARGHAFLHRLEAIAPQWDMAIEEVDGSNHTGSTSRSRWWRYLSDRCPELLGHDDAEQRLSYEAWWYPAWSRIRLVPPPILPGGLLVTHGTLARKHGGYSARAHGEIFVGSVLHGHTHRIGSSLKRVPAMGARPEGLIRAYECGCLCKLGADYAPHADWAQGFAIITHDADTEEYGVEQCVINNGRAVVNALGGLVAA